MQDYRCSHIEYDGTRCGLQPCIAYIISPLTSGDMQWPVCDKHLREAKEWNTRNTRFDEERLIIERIGEE